MDDFLGELLFETILGTRTGRIVVVSLVVLALFIGLLTLEFRAMEWLVHLAR
jgi:putative copper export protein